MHKVNPSIREAEARETEVQGHLLLQVNVNGAYMGACRETDRQRERERERMDNK